MTAFLRCQAAVLVLAFFCFTSSAGDKAFPIVFRDITKDAGLHEPLAGIMGHGGAWGDFDNDGLIDLYIGGFCDRPNAEYKPAAGPVPNMLFRNLGNGRFEQVKQAAVTFFGRTSGAVFADLDNDGWLELYSANNAKAKAQRTDEPQKSAQVRHSLLFRNTKGVFEDISAQSGACPSTLFTARNIGVFDYDADGLLDLLVVEDRFTPRPRTALFRNKGNLQFEDVSQKVGLPDNLFGLGLAVADLNGDGRPDFFVPHSNRLFLSTRARSASKGEDVTYREALELKSILAWVPLDGEDWPCGAAFGDLDRDGRLDLVVAIHGKKARNKVFLNDGLKNGVLQFRDVTKEAGLGDVIPVRCPHVEIQDLDNDGWPDIYISAAWMDEAGKITPLVYRNEGRKEGLPRFTPPRPIGGNMVYYPAGPSGDFDNDGRLDLFLINWFQGNHSRLLKNDSTPRNWLQVQVVGKTLNRMGLGCQIRLYRAGELGNQKALVGFQELSIGYGYASGQPALCHFGLGDLERVDLEATLPSGKKLVRKNIESKKRIVLEE
ncbi:MAG: CRTAC1 family protein [Gemmataceae bacterium]|nr:CRTAC1 family protein [Gemmataceae bacterium]MCI0743260.1 CRTAC1 family protein [Gemmataceae bacterium]